MGRATESKSKSADVAIVTLATELGRLRQLSDRESRMLEAAVRRQQRTRQRTTMQWTQERDARLITSIRGGKLVCTIAREMHLTNAAVRRRIWKLGGVTRIVKGSGADVGKGV